MVGGPTSLLGPLTDPPGRRRHAECGIRGFPKTRGLFLGSPYNEGRSLLESFLGPPIYRHPFQFGLNRTSET